MKDKMNKIHNIDCLEFMKKVPNNYFDLSMTSPPYNMRLRISNGKYTNRENSDHFSKKYKHFDDCMPIEDYYDFHKQSIKELIRISKIVVYNFQIVTGSKEAFFKIIGDFSSEIKDIIIWDKIHGQPAMHSNVLNSSYELILLFENDNKKGRSITNSYFKRGELSNVWRIGRGKREVEEHNAVMPDKLAKEIVRNFSPCGGTVFDPFMGSGTTAIACQSLRRDWCGCEIEHQYIEIANKRLEKVQGSLF